MNLESEFSIRREQTAKDQTMMTWIVVLAVAITCCAILFLIFANYLAGINRNLAAADARLTVMESNEAQLLSEIQALRRTVIATQAKVPPVTATPPQPAVLPPSPTTPQAPAPMTH